MKKVAAGAGLAVGRATAGWGISAIAGTAVAGASTSAPNASLAASRTAQPVSSQDRTFMDQASEINLTEISLGRYMQAHSTTTSAKNLGGIYARDHIATKDRLLLLPPRPTVTLPRRPGAQLEPLLVQFRADRV